MDPVPVCKPLQGVLLILWTGEALLELIQGLKEIVGAVCSIHAEERDRDEGGVRALPKPRGGQETMLDVLAFPALESDHQYKGSDYRLAHVLPCLKGAAMMHGTAVYDVRALLPP